MFNSHANVNAVFEHKLNDYKGVQVTRIVHDLYESDPKRGFYGGGGFDARPFWRNTDHVSLSMQRRDQTDVGRRIQGPAGAQLHAPDDHRL